MNWLTHAWTRMRASYHLARAKTFLEMVEGVEIDDDEVASVENELKMIMGPDEAARARARFVVLAGTVKRKKGLLDKGLAEIDKADALVKALDGE